MMETDGVAAELRGPLTFDSLLTDPLIRLMAESDGELVETMLRALARAEAAALTFRQGKSSAL